MNNIKNSKLLLLTIFIISIAIVIFFKYLSQNSCFWGDDFLYPRYRMYEGYFDSFKYTFGHGSGYLGLFLCKFFSFGLPAILHIHPNDFLCNGASIIRGVLTCLVLLSITILAVDKNKSKLLFLLIYLFTASYFFLNGLKSNVILINYNYYRYFFSLLFYSVFWLYIYKNIISDEKFVINKKEIITLLLMGFCGYVLGTSIEINFFISLMLAGLIIIYNLFFRRCKYKLNTCFYLPVGVLCCAISLFTESFGFKEVASDRGLSDINVTYDILKEFSQVYYRICFKEEVIYWIIFICIAVSAFIIAKKNNKIKLVIFPMLMQLSILTVMYSLILCGRTYDLNGRMILFLYHSNIIFLYKMLILIPLYMLFDYVISSAQIKKIEIIILFLLLVGSVINILECKKLSMEFKSRLSEHKKHQYMYEKIMRFYNLKGEKAKVPQEFLKEFDELNRSETHKSTQINSMNLIYKDNLAYIYGYEIVPDGLELFYIDGGTFSEEELSDIKFSLLYDNDYVLNKKN